MLDPNLLKKVISSGRITLGQQTVAMGLWDLKSFVAAVFVDFDSSASGSVARWLRLLGLLWRVADDRGCEVLCWGSRCVLVNVQHVSVAT